MRVALLTLAVFIGLPAMASAEPPPRGEERRSAAKCPSAHQGLRFYSKRIEMWQDRLGAEPRWNGEAGRNRPTAVRNGSPASCPRYLAKVRRTKARNLRLHYERQLRLVRLERRKLYRKWECIHRHEGAWNDPNPPYWGGLQMSRWFQQTYGPEFYARWGTADNWPVWAQIEAAERAYRSDGDYGQWPNTARECGLPT